jgi:hypothetical protein
MTMIEIDVCIPIIAAIIGIGYPIFLQVSTNLEEKYNSHLIGELFNAESERRFLNISIILSLISALLVLLNRPPWFDFGVFNIIVDNSAVLLLILFTIILVTCFFFFVKKVLIYNSKLKFIEYLIRKHSKSNAKSIIFIFLANKNFITKLLNQIFKKEIYSKSNSKIFKAISDMLYYSIRIQDSELAQIISRFIYTSFAQQREISYPKPTEYPIEYYQLAYKATEELALLNNNRLLFLEARSAGAIWLLGEKKDFEISETTYKWLWLNLLLPIKYNKDSMIMSFWETAHQYFSFRLPIIHEIFEKREITNQVEINERNNSRKGFLEFTHALGGLLLYKRKYSCLSRMLKYTTSIPPNYELLPASMDEVMRFYFNYKDPYEDNYPWITVRYSFPDLDGITADYVIKKWICAYTVILFIRQFTLVPSYIFEKPLEPPSIPKTMREKRMWIDNMDFFIDLVKEHMLNTELLDTLNFNHINDQWCAKREVLCPVSFAEEIKKRVVTEYKKQEVEQEISQPLLDTFYNSTIRILNRAFETYKSIKNNALIETDYKELFILGERALVDKSPFAPDQEAENMNYDSFLAESVANRIHYGVSEILYGMKTKTYILDPQDLFKGIEKLNINADNYVIINYGIHLPYYISDLRIPDLTIYNYKNFKIYTFPQFNIRLVRESLFILKKTDLPNIDYLDISDEEKVKYNLKLLNDEYKVYASVIDLFKFKELQKDFSDQTDENTLNKSVIIDIVIKNRIRWKTKISVIQLKSFMSYREKGTPDNLNNIIPLN